MRMIVALIACVIMGFTAAPVRAQEDDKGFLTRTIQDALSGSGREVSIDGFRGALSSSASFDVMRIADEDGVWLELGNVVLEWNRKALLRGRLEVESLTAERLDIPRLPLQDSDQVDLPDAAAKPFSLPDLPVSIRIDTFSIGRITLGAPILGAPAELTVTASAELNDSLGDIDLQARRTDGKRGAFVIQANFERSDGILDLLLRLSEGEQGIAARLLNIPDQPSVELSVQGSGPVDAFAADVKLATAGQDRLAGRVTLGTQTPQRASTTPDRRIQADIGGDITALLAPRYRAFFGEDVTLKLDALLQSNGAVEVRDFALGAQAAQLAGKVHLNAQKWPTLIDVKGTVANPDGTPIVLPVGGEGTSVNTVDLAVDYDASDGDAVVARFDIDTLMLSDLTLGRTQLAMNGKLQSAAGRVGQFDGDVSFDASGLMPRDSAVADALGAQITGVAGISYAEGQPLRISGFDLSGIDYGLTGDAVIAGFDTGLLTDLNATLTARDLSRFSTLAGQKLSGQTELALEGDVTILSGAFDLNARGSTTDLRVDIAQADAVLAGRTALSVMAKRDEAGTFLRDLVLENDALSLRGEAELRAEASRAQADFRLNDLSLVLPQYDGPIQVSATATQDDVGWSIDARSDGPYRAALTANGLATGLDAALRFTADVPNMRPLVPQIDGPLRAAGLLRNTTDGWLLETQADGPNQTTAKIVGLITPQLNVRFDLSTPNVQPFVPQVNGPLRATGALRQTPNGFALQTNASGPYSARASVQGIVTGPTANVDFSVNLPNVGSLVDDVSGPLSINGTARKQANAWRVDSEATGPVGTQAQLGGLVNESGTLNLDVKGSAPLGLSRPFLVPRDLQGLARFDLSVNGPAALSSVTGSIQTSGATLAVPNLRLALQGIAADIRLAGKRAQVVATGQSVNGGRVRLGGSIVLNGSLPADLAIGLENIVLIDPRLYRSTINGALRLAGPLSGGAQITGRVNVGETNVSVPSTGLTSIGDIPPINHIGATRPVIATRRKAGIENATAGDDPVERNRSGGYGLNVRVTAPNRIFVRGRGIDAELGGGLTVTGTTRRIISAGRFDLQRGRLDILGKRFDLVEGSIQFQGDLVPFIRFVSATQSQTGEVRVIVQGPTDAPEVRFESTPEAPQDEVLAQLLFGRSLSEISPFQALQLANAVATLAGRGGIAVISNLREGFGLDDLDVTTTDSGATAVRAGKYLSENIYTDVTAASDGSGEVSLNLDITSNLKGKATLGSDGNGGIGLFFEKDY